MIRSITLIALLLVGTSVFACPKQGKMFERAIESLQLDESRAAQVQAILDQGKVERKSLKDSGASKDEMRALRTSQKEQLATVLTEEELQSLKDMRKKGHKKQDKDCRGKKDNAVEE